VSLVDQRCAGEVLAVAMVLVGRGEGPGHQRVRHQATLGRGVRRRDVDWRGREKVDGVNLY